MQKQANDLNYIIQANNVHKSFKDVHAVQGLSLNIKHGEFIALLGPNGAGKTTFVEMVEGIRIPDEGEIILNGMTWNVHREKLHYILGISLQETRFIDKLRVRETLALFASFYDAPESRVDEILELINLTEKKKAFVENLSGGQRQRLALGISIINEPKILILDEPTTGLDPTARREIWKILLDLRKKSGMAMLLTTHYMEEAEYLCDYIIIMDKGKILTQGTLEELIKDNQQESIVEFSYLSDTENKDWKSEFAHLNIKWDKTENKAWLFAKDLQNELFDFLSIAKKTNLKTDQLNCRKMTLDDLFISMTGRHLSE